MTLLNIDVSYHGHEALKKIGREKLLELRANLPHLKLPDWKDDKDAPEYWYHDGLLIELETDGKLLSSLGIEFSVKRFHNNYFADDVFEKARWYGSKIPETASAVHVHIPNIGLLMIDEVTWIEDACTEKLQDMLDAGFRILAVCPPNGARRPDYILGRQKGMTP